MRSKPGQKVVLAWRGRVRQTYPYRDGEFLVLGPPVAALTVEEGAISRPACAPEFLRQVAALSLSSSQSAAETTSPDPRPVDGLPS